MPSSPADVVRAANEALLARRDLDAIPAHFTPDYVVHLTEKDLKGGHDTTREVVSKLLRAFPDLEVEVTVLLEAEDRVSWQRTLRGTHQGSYGGFPASGEALVWRDMATSRVEEGRIAEEWMVSDLAEQLLRARRRK
ncbi:MAG: ester cyclase [Alphaproteobacteria bacterium]|nr:ester cyclase [Alphaproteobacteria bacterium]